MSSDAEITLILADDHDLVRSALRVMLDSEPNLHVIAEAADVTTVLTLVAERKPDVLLLDLHMPGGDGLEAIPALLRSSPDTRVVMLTADRDPGSARDAIAKGAVGYVPKDAARATLLEAIRTVADGRTYLEAEMGAQMVSAQLSGPVEDDPLTERERQVLRLLAEGNTNRDIAGQLFLSIRTVETHRARIQQKTGRSSRAELYAWAVERGIIKG